MCLQKCEAKSDCLHRAHCTEHCAMKYVHMHDGACAIAALCLKKCEKMCGNVHKCVCKNVELAKSDFLHSKQRTEHCLMKYDLCTMEKICFSVLLLEVCSRWRKELSEDLKSGQTDL